MELTSCNVADRLRDTGAVCVDIPRHFLAVDMPVISMLELVSSLLSLEKRVKLSVLPRVSQQCVLA